MSHSDAWWAKYEIYLRSREWREKRADVLERDNYRCQARLAHICARRATEVHHITYAHVGNEPMWELRSLCHECHEAITTMDRERRNDGRSDWFTESTEPPRNTIEPAWLEAFTVLVDLMEHGPHPVFIPDWIRERLDIRLSTDGVVPFLPPLQHPVEPLPTQWKKWTKPTGDAS